ncbi:Gldg family protein [Roseiarcaceae bacterium H3SJ34-1]|uniref:Gldg family protein n=1 Tax=Terripilifer ovatus TaxID=3032367 RepID=UPI003AB96063|nr:Gldg family protein [Roseiarcaceae bacterium H3SJ34-1]
MNQKSFHTGRLAVLAAIFAAIIFGCVNIASSELFRSARIDLTQQHLFSLSQGTRTMIADLNEPIRFRFFMSSGLTKEAPQLAAFAGRVRSMLDAYVAGSKGKIVLETIDAKPYSEDEDRAVAFGISPIRSSTGDRLFFGLAATNSTDGKSVIGSFSPEREAFLEYDLTRLVAELGKRGKPVVAVLDGLGMNGNPQLGLREAQVLTQMKQFFDVKPLEGEVQELPDNTRVVMVVHPQNLTDKTLYTLDQWAVGGGAMLVFVDPNAENQIGPRGQPPADTSSDMPKLFKAWGVVYDPKKAVADPTYALQTERNIDGRPVTMLNLPWLALRNEALKKDDAILAQLAAIVITTSGSFETNKDGMSIRPLMVGSADAGTLPAAEVKERTADMRKLATQIEKGKAPPVIAGRLTGTLESAFTAKPEGSTRKEEHIAKATKPANVILVGDADMVMDRNWVQRRNLLGTEVAQAFANNGDFVVNAIEQMAGGVALADLRGRGVSWRPFERIQTMEAEANARYSSKEQQLQARMKDAEQKLQDLGRGGKEGSNEVLTPQQIETIEKFKTELLATREELRATQFALRNDVDTLKSRLTALNVAGIPIVAGLIALFFAMRRTRRDPPSTKA